MGAQANLEAISAVSSWKMLWIPGKTPSNNRTIRAFRACPGTSRHPVNFLISCARAKVLEPEFALFKKESAQRAHCLKWANLAEELSIYYFIAIEPNEATLAKHTR